MHRLSRVGRLFFLICCLVLLLLSPVISLPPATAQTTPPAGYNKLRDLSVVSTSGGSMWAGSGNGSTIDAPGTVLPMDTVETFNGLPSLVINVTTGGGWWSVVLSGSAGWENYSLVPYQAGGFLEFNVKGAAGGESFQLGLKDRVKERTPVESLMPPNKLQSTSYVNVTTSWQNVKIPLKDFVPVGTPTSTFDLNQMFLIDITNASSNALKFWLNDIKFTSPDNEPAFAPIKVNQVGYTTTAEKYALVSGFQETLTANAGTAFQVKRKSDNVAVHSGTLTLVSSFDAVTSGERVLKADFSTLTTAGEYYISVTGLPDSVSFKIDNAMYRTLVTDAMRYFYYQRQGIALVAPFAGTYTRGIGHPQDANTQFQSGCCGVKDTMKGWYDAGDYGKYVSPGATAISDILWAYWLYPGVFGDNTNIPESGNGIVDALDEVKWELDWLVKMQDATSGGFWQMMQSDSDEGPPDASTLPRLIKDVEGSRTNVRPTSATGSAAGVLAEAYLAFKDINPTYAATLLAAAEKAWTYLEANPGGVAGVPGPYQDNDDKDDRFYAAGALFRATGKAVYNNYVLANYQAMSASSWDKTDDNAHFVGSMQMIGYINYVLAPGADATAVTWIRGKFNSWRTMMLDRANNGVWGNMMQDNDFFWGSSMLPLHTAQVLAMGSKAFGTYDAAIIGASRRALNYILGVNPLRFSFVSGYGADSMKKIFSAIFSTDNKPGIPPGYIAGGTNSYNNLLLWSNFSGKRYNDSDSAWTTNENAIYWNSALVFGAALVASEAVPVGPTPTPVTPTRTPTTCTTCATNTPIPPSPTRTNTPVTPTSIVPTNTQAPTTIPGAFSVQIRGGGSDNNQQTAFAYVVRNTGSSAAANVSVRVYFTLDTPNVASNYVLEKYYDQSGIATISAPTLACGSTYYIAVNYGTASLGANQQWELQTALHLANWGTNYSAANDHFHTGYAVGALPAANTATTYLPVFVNGTLAAGVVPACVGSTPTNTPTVATATATRTNTPATPTRTLIADGVDLVVVSITAGNSGALCQNQLATNVTVRNSGFFGTTASFTVRLNNTQDRVVNGLAAGASTTVQFSGIMMQSTAVVDATNVIAETNETNNSLTSNLPIPSQAATCTPTTGTRTSTATATRTRTATRTNTPGTPTRTATRTNTPLTPTVTRTSTPVTPTVPPPVTLTFTPAPSTLKVQYKAADTNTGDNQLKPHFRIVNTGTTAVALSELKIRYYFTRDNSAGLNFNCDWAQVGCGNLSMAFVAATGTNTDTYLEISFAAGAGSVAAGGNTGEIQARINHSDWTNFNEANDYSFDATKINFADWNRVVLLRNGNVVWGTAP